MGALCEQPLNDLSECDRRCFNDPIEPVNSCWSYGWKPAYKNIAWLNNFVIGPNGIGDVDGHLELIIGVPLRSDIYNPE